MTPNDIWKEDKKQIAYEPQKLIIVTKNEHLESFVQQNSPVNNEMIRSTFINELFRQDITGQLMIVPTEVKVRDKNGKAPAIYTLCSFSYGKDTDLELFNQNGRYRITAYDRRVYNAVSTLWMNKRDIVTLTEIFEVMNGYVRKNPSSDQLMAIEKSLYKFASIRLYIDFTAEIKANLIKDKDVLIKAGILKNNSDKIKSAVIDDAMLHFRVGTITSEQGKVYKSIHIIDEPCLLSYNRAKGTLLTVPMEFIGLRNSSTTERNVAFQDYLLTRIISYKNGKMKENKILYQTLYRDSGIDMPSDKRILYKDREKIETIMKEWKEKGLILDYASVKTGKKIVGINFEIEKK